MKISVCMGTYNGELYLEEQLISILNQSRKPDEVILCDDGSSDKTVDLILNFIKAHHLSGSWHLYRNPERMGYPGNFYYAMGLCSGDIVFLADQDDIWELHKIERMSKVLEEKPRSRAICCKFGLVDASGTDIHTIMQPARSKESGEIRNVGIGDVFYKCEWPGMVIAYRRDWFMQCMQNGENRKQTQIPHDFIICAWAAEEGGFLQMDEELAYHRRHDNNTGGEEHRLKKLLNRDRKLKEIEAYNKILDAFAKEEVMRTPEGSEALERKRRSMRDRYDALSSGKVMNVLRSAWRNRKGTRLAAVLSDCYCSIFG